MQSPMSCGPSGLLTSISNPPMKRLSQATDWAVIYKDQDRYSEAITLFALALEEAEIALGPGDLGSG